MAEDALTTPAKCRFCETTATHKVTFKQGSGFVAWIHLCPAHLQTWSGHGVPEEWPVDSIEPIEPGPDTPTA